MGIFNIFKRQNKSIQKESALSASATLYPEKILIETIDTVKEGFGISSTNITVLPINVEAEALGAVVRHHLKLTKVDVPIPKDYHLHYKEFLQKAGFKNGKEHHKNALYITITERKNQIIISPTKNGGYTGKDRGFVPIKEAELFISADTENSTIGNILREGWSKCK